MLRCLMDVSIPEEDKCGKCCINCEDKDTCEHRCCGIDEWKQKKRFIQIV